MRWPLVVSPQWELAFAVFLDDNWFRDDLRARCWRIPPIDRGGLEVEAERRHRQHRNNRALYHRQR
jgi:hypothetical protein